MKQPGFWKKIIRPPELTEGTFQREQWTRDILQMMWVVILAATLLIGAGVLGGIFSFLDTLPIYILFLLITPAWWGARHGGWRWARFFPTLLCFALGMYISITSGFNSTGLFYALAVLLAGMLINRFYQWAVVVLIIVSFFTYFGILQGEIVFMENLGTLITLSFLLVGISLLQGYYDTRLRRSLSDKIKINQALAEENARRQRAETNLRDQEAQLRRLAENTTDLVGEISPDGIYRYASPSNFTTLGYLPEALVGSNAFDLVHPDDLPAAYSNAQKAAASRTPGKVQLRCRHAEGYYIYVETSGTPLYNDAGELDGFVLSSRDITQQKLAENATQESEAKFRHIIDSSPMGIHMYSLEDGALIFTGYNPAADTLLGIDHASLIGKTIEDAFPGLVETEVPGHYRQIARDGIPWNSEQVSYTDHRINGAFEVHAFQYAPGKTVVMFLDATARIKAVEALHLSEEKFSKAFLTSPDAININRLTDGLYIDINQGFTQLTGFTQEDAVGKTSLELNIWNDPADRARLVQGLRERGEVENLEARFKFKDGTIKTGLMSARVMEINHEMCILSVTRDISDRIRAEEELRETHAQLEEAYEATLQGWVRALELREHETADHSRRVVELTLRMAVELGVDEGNMIQIERGALLHDIGKMGVPDNILLKPGPLTAEEWTIMRFHPWYAYELMVKIPYLQPSMDIPYCHHEKWDGSGYPRGLAGSEIPLPARIFSVVDVYDALRSNRSYRPAWSKQDVLQYLVEQKCKYFDPQIVDRFLTVVVSDS